MSEAVEVDSEVVSALDNVAEAANDTATDCHRIAERARRLRDRYVTTGRMRTALEQERRPRLVEMVSAALSRLSLAGSRARRAQASTMRSEGAGPSEIARLFGVSRQRASAILERAEPAGEIVAGQAGGSDVEEGPPVQP